MKETFSELVEEETLVLLRQAQQTKSSVDRMAKNMTMPYHEIDMFL